MNSKLGMMYSFLNVFLVGDSHSSRTSQMQTKSFAYIIFKNVLCMTYIWYMYIVGFFEICFYSLYRGNPGT